MLTFDDVEVESRRFYIDTAFEYLTEISTQRSNRWHKDAEQQWNIMEWAAAVCGEAGELANIAKKIRRVETGMQSIGSAGLQPDQLPELYKKLGQECADTFLYLILLAKKANVDFAQVIVDKFNTKSAEYGFPERL